MAVASGGAQGRRPRMAGPKDPSHPNRPPGHPWPGRSRPIKAVRPFPGPGTPDWNGRAVAAGLACPSGRSDPVPKHGKPLMEVLDEAECLRLISPGGVGRIAYLRRYDLTVLPVNYRSVTGDIPFRAGSDSNTGQDLPTGITNADFKVGFELNELDGRAQEGWSVLIQGPAHHFDSPADQKAAEAAGVHSWP